VPTVTVPIPLDDPRVLIPVTRRFSMSRRPTVVIPVNLTFVAVRIPILYLSVPVPVIPLSSLLTNSNQFPPCAKYPLPSE
jgi:hypothetical protein